MISHRQPFHLAQDSLLPRETMPGDTPVATLPHGCHAKCALRAQFPTPATSKGPASYACDVKRALSNAHVRNSQPLPRGSTVQHFIKSQPASGAPLLPRETHRNSLACPQRRTSDRAPRGCCHNSPCLPRETTASNAQRDTFPQIPMAQHKRACVDGPREHGRIPRPPFRYAFGESRHKTNPNAL